MKRKKILLLRIDNKAIQRNLNDPIMALNIYTRGKWEKKKKKPVRRVSLIMDRSRGERNNIKSKLKRPPVIISLAFAGDALFA